MKKIAIRQKIGHWIYYTTTFTFKEVVENVQKEWKSEMGLDTANNEERMQRDLEQKNVEQISNYIMKQEDMFFNSLVLAVYNGNPQWREVRIDYDNDEHYDIGILELTEQDRIFPVDGQHRVEGIRLAIEQTNGNKETGDNYYNTQSIPVILVAHENTKEGKKRTRRLFTTLNRYAKPVNKTDIILLDEDDIVAITTRQLLDSHKLFQDKVLLTQTKAIPKNDRVSFTNIQTLYDCNYELLKYYLKINALHITRNNKPKIVNPNSKLDIVDFLKFRRSEPEINDFYKFLVDFWDQLSSLTPLDMFLNFDEENCVQYYNDKDEEKFYSELFLRGPISPKEKEDLYYMIDDSMCPLTIQEAFYPFKEGGNLLFRPFGLLTIVSVICEQMSQGIKLSTILNNLDYIDLSLTTNIWNNIVYNVCDDRMITSNKKLFKDILAYLINSKNTSKEKVDEIIKKIFAIIFDANELKSLLNGVSDSEREFIEKDYRQSLYERIKISLEESTSLSIMKKYKKEYGV